MESLTVELRSNYNRSFRRFSFCAAILCFALVGGAAIWSVYARIDGAVISPGSFGVESHIKKVQHSEGGIVKKLLVANDDRVKAGDVLIELDDTLLRTELETTRSSLDEYVAIEARLLAEQIGAKDLVFTKASLKLATGSADFDVIVRAQQQLMQARNESMQNRANQLKDQIVQIEEQIKGLQFQRDAKDGELQLISEELVGLNELLSKKLVSKTRATSLSRQKTRLAGEKGRLVSDIAVARRMISERELQVIQVGDMMRGEVLEQLQGVRIKKAGLVQQKAALEDRISRLKVRATQDGLIHERTVNTIGGVVGPGEVLLSIVPEQDRLIIEAKASPFDIDQIFVGQEARVRPSSLNMRSTPELFGKVISVSPDVSLDAATQQSYYAIRVSVSSQELERLQNVEILPGMPVEIFMVTGERTFAEYILEPLRLYISKSFRET